MSEQNSGSHKLPEDITVTVVGLGQIGLPLAVLAALQNYKVCGIDIDTNRLEKIRILDELAIEGPVSLFLQEEQVIANLQLNTAITKSTAYFVICVPTFLDDQGNAVVEVVEKAAQAIVPFLTKEATVIIESTMPVGASRKIAKFLEKESGLHLEKDLFVAYSPERILPGQAFKELVFNDRVIGGFGDKGISKALNFYQGIIKGKILTTSPETAELVKIAENSHRLVQIAFANQMAEVARSVGVDPFSLIKLANHHPRVNILNPGIGVGGDCVPVHPLFLKSHDNSLPSLIKEAININSQQEDMVVQEVLSSVQRFKKLHKKSKPKVLLLGLTYKPNVADIRNAPAIRIAKRLAQEEGLQLKVYDPMLDSNQIKKIGFVHLEALSDYKTMDLVVFLVAHAKFNQIRELNDLPEGSLVDPIGFMRACETLPPMREATTD